jgi:hypothetical protein
MAELKVREKEYPSYSFEASVLTLDQVQQRAEKMRSRFEAPKVMFHQHIGVGREHETEHISAHTIRTRVDRPPKRSEMPAIEVRSRRPWPH